MPPSDKEAAIPAPSPTPPEAESSHPGDASPRLVGKARGRTKWLVNGYITCTVLVGLALFALFYNPDWKLDWLGLATFAIGVVLTEWLAFDIYDARGTAVSTSTVPMLAGILLFGPGAALILSLTLATVALFKHRSPISLFFFNASNQLIAAMLYLALIEFTGEVFIHQLVL